MYQELRNKHRRPYRRFRRRALRIQYISRGGTRHTPARRFRFRYIFLPDLKTSFPAVFIYLETSLLASHVDLLRFVARALSQNKAKRL